MKTPRLRSGGRKAAKPKDVLCPECGGAIQVAPKAQSVFCPHCSKRVILEDFRVTGFHASRDFATAGNIVVEASATVTAPIKVRHLIVKGQVRGRVLAWGSVSVARNGHLRGDVTTPLLVVESGGNLEGFCRIGVGPEVNPPTLRQRRKTVPAPGSAAPRARARRAKRET